MKPLIKKKYKCKKLMDLINVIKYDNVTHFFFGDNFNQPMDMLKGKLQNLSKLSFGKHFNQPIDALNNSFPNLTKLSFGHSFNQLIDA